MILKNSPFHPSNKIKNVNISNQSTKVNDESRSFSFLKWIKGAINPLQNLPLISGIYSSINSDNKDSDRDMIQNSLGGFLYGGPFGAIAGFGNWVFNKVFDRTPAELVLNLTGISKIWKKSKKTEEKIAEIVHPEINSKDIQKKINLVPVLELENIQKGNLKKAEEIIKIEDNLIEFNYPRWKPNDEVGKDPKSLNLSNLNKIYLIEKAHNKNTINKIA